MSCYIDTSGKLLHERAATLALTCPHCDVLAHITPIAVPGFDELSTHKPRHAGVVYRCDACQAPIFLRFPVKAFTPHRIELSSQFHEVEKREERFNYAHLPEDVAQFFREALGCFAGGHLNAFVSMCRRTMKAAQSRMTEANRLWVLEQLNDTRKLADLDDATYAEVRKIVSGEGTEQGLPLLSELQCGSLLEVMKDLLYQIYVRKGRLQQAISMRRYFADESTQGIRVDNDC